MLGREVEVSYVLVGGGKGIGQENWRMVVGGWWVVVVMEEGFEPPKDLRPCLISSPSKGVVPHFHTLLSSVII